MLIFFSFISISNCTRLQPIGLREKGDQTLTKVISAKIGGIQDFVCPHGQEFSLYLVSSEDYRQCKQFPFPRERAFFECNTPWNEGLERKKVIISA